MKVKELIEKLSKVDPELNVFYKNSKNYDSWEEVKRISSGFFIKEEECFFEEDEVDEIEKSKKMYSIERIDSIGLK